VIAKVFQRFPFTQLALLLMLCTSESFAQVWTQLAPLGSPPPAAAGVGGLDQANDRMIIVYVNGNPQTSWVLTNADGLGGTPQWLSFATLPDPVHGPAPFRGELPTGVYDATSNRVITFAGCTGTCGSATNDVWVLTNANGLSGTPGWLKLAPSGPLPQPRASHSAAYDPGSNRMIIFAGQDGCCAQQHSFGDVWVLTNANGLGGTPAWIPLSPAGGPPLGQSEMRVVYDAAGNRLTVFGGWPYASNVPTNAVWVLSNANGLGGAPAWTNLVPEGSPGSPPARGLQGAVYEPATNRMIVFAGFAPPTNTVYNDTWALSGANGIGSAAWTQVSTTGGPPGARDFPLAVFNTSSNRMTIWGGGDVNGGLADTWVLAPATPPSISGLPAPGCTLWPANHKLVEVATVTASDELGLSSFNVTATSSEPEDGLGDGDTAPDILITGSGLGPRLVQLRAERSGTGPGRTYTITASATNVAGLSASATATCTVPHDHGNR
jgi:Kelch motif protein/galactose oxidase-like protein